MGEFRFNPHTPHEAAALFAGFARPWWIAGGRAVDLHLGRGTRQHDDTDIAILRGDEVAMAAALRGWDIKIAELGRFIEWDGSAPVERPFHQFWMRERPDGDWDYEVLLEDHDVAGTWAYRRDARVTLPMAEFGHVSADGVPYIAPAVVLLYKAKGWPEIGKNVRDFEWLAPALTTGEREWLRRALEVAHPGHVWIGALD